MTTYADPADVLALCARANRLHRRALAELRRATQIVTATSTSPVAVAQTRGGMGRRSALVAGVLSGGSGAGTRLVGRYRRRTGST